MHFEPGDKHSLTHKVYLHIRDNILEGRYATGEYLVETRLAEELDVSRTPIREALKQLELEELVVAIPNRGVMVQGLSETDVEDIFTIRHLLEGQAAYWAALRIGEDQLKHLAETVELMDLYTRKNDAARLAALDSEFHDIIFSASNSRTLKHILTSLHQNVQRARRSSLAVPARSHKSLDEHTAIYQAIQQHRAKEAKALMEAHVSNAHHVSAQQ